MTDAILSKFDFKHYNPNMKLLFSILLMSIITLTLQNDVYGQSSQRRINIRSLKGIKEHGEYLHMLCSNDYILRVKKDNLQYVYDTLHIEQAQIKEAVFQNLFGEDYTAKLDTMTRLAVLAEVRDNFQVNDFEVAGDTLMLLTQINYPYQPSETSVRVKRVPSITKIVNGELLSCDVVDYSRFSNGGKDSMYYIETGSFKYYNNRLYFNVRKDSVTDKNYFFAETRTSSNKIKCKSIVEYLLPNSLVQSKTGYLMSQSLLYDGIVSNVYSDTLYDLNDKVAIDLGISYKNTIRKDDALILKPKVDFTVFGFSKTNDTLSVIYKSGEDIWLGTYTYVAKGKIRNVKSSNISAVFEGISPFSTVANREGFYVFDANRMEFRYVAYKDYM